MRATIALRLIAGMRKVTDNMAHDLKTPLARIRASAERAAARGATQGDGSRSGHGSGLGLSLARAFAGPTAATSPP